MYSPPESPAYYNTPSDDEYEGTNISDNNSSFPSLDSYGSNLTSHNQSMESSDEKKKASLDSKIDWFEFLVHPKKLDQHLEDLQKDKTIQPSALDLAITFIEQCSPPTDSKTQQINDRTKRYISIVTKIAFKSNFTLEEIETKFPIPFQKHIILGTLLRKRKHSGVQGIVHTSSQDKLAEIDLSKIDTINDKSFEDMASSYIEIIYHRWVIRSISKRLPLWFIKSPSLEGTESYDLVQLGEESLKSLEKLATSAEKNPGIFDNLIDKPDSLDKIVFSMALILDMANYYFFREDFQNSFKYLRSLHEKLSKYSDKNLDPLKESCNTLIIACQSVIMTNNHSDLSLLLPENKKTLFFRQIDEIVKSLNNQSEVMSEKSQLLIDLLIQDIMENQLSREYRVSLCYKLIEKENLFKKILACNIIQDMVKIIQGHSIQQDIENSAAFDQSIINEKSKHSIIPDGNDGINVSVQTHLDRYVLKHKFVTSQPIIPVYIIVFLKRLELEFKKSERNNDSIIWDNNMNLIISDFVCRLAKYVNHPIVYATLLSEGHSYLNSNEENIQIFTALMLESVEKSYHLSNFENVSSLEYQDHNYGLLPENVQHKLLTACSEKKTENSSYFQNLKTSIAKKRVYDATIKANHILFSDDLDEVLKHEPTNFEPLKRLKTETSDYLSLRARSLLYRNSFKSPILTHKAKTFFDISMAINRFKDFETSKRIAFDKLLLSLSAKSLNNLIIEEYATPRIESKQIERPSPHIDCMEEFSTLCELCNLQKIPSTDSSNLNEKTKPDLSHINLVFLGELFKKLMNLGDWAFIRDFFKQIQTVYEQHTSDDVHIVFCRFAILVESLAYHMHTPRNGAPKKVFKDLKDDIYKFVNNLIYLPDQYHYENDSLNFEDENRLRWDDFHLLTSTSNLKFLMDLAIMLSFVLVSVRMTVAGNRSTSPPILRNPTQPIMTGHYKHLAKLIMPEYFCSSTKKNWLLGNEKFVEDTLIIMLQHVLERVINLQEQYSNKPISSFYLFKCCLADVYFEKGKFRRALELYLECGEINFPHFYKPSNEEVVERMFRCLVELGEYTAAAVLHQFVHSTYDNEIESQSRTHVISDNFINSSNRIGYTKEIIDNLYEANGLNERWLLYFYDLSYLELVVHIAHQKGEFNKEDLIIQHIQRSEINSNNKTDHRKEYIQAMKETFLRRLYLHITTFLKN